VVQLNANYFRCQLASYSWMLNKTLNLIRSWIHRVADQGS
jgi:hypothetical protein